MNDGHVALHTRQDMKEHPSIPDEEYNVKANAQDPCAVSINPSKAEEEPHGADELDSHQVEGETVRVAHRRRRGGGALLLPLLQAVVEDEDAQREEQDQQEDGERRVEDGGGAGPEADQVEGERRVPGRHAWIRKAGVEERRGVQRRFCCGGLKGVVNRKNGQLKKKPRKY